MVAHKAISIRRACRLFSVSETCYRYQPKFSDDNALIADRLLRLTYTTVAGAWSMLFVSEERQGMHYNHKRVYRIYRELKLNFRIKPRRRLKRDKPDSLYVPRHNTCSIRLSMLRIWRLSGYGNIMLRGHTRAWAELPRIRSWRKPHELYFWAPLKKGDYSLTCTTYFGRYRLASGPLRTMFLSLLHTMRTALSRTSGEYLFDVFITPSSQNMESQVNPGRFTYSAVRPSEITCVAYIQYILAYNFNPYLQYRTSPLHNQCTGMLPFSDSSTQANRICEGKN